MVRNRPSVAYGRVETVSAAPPYLVVQPVANSIKFVKNLKAEKKYERLGAVGYILFLLPEGFVLDWTV